MYIPWLLSLATTALLVLLRGGGSSQARSFVLAFMGLAILQTPFHGGSYGQSYASSVIFYALNPCVPPLLLRWAMLFPEEVSRPRRAALALPWLLTPLMAFLRWNYFVEGPMPGELAQDSVRVVEVLLCVTRPGLTYAQLPPRWSNRATSP